MPPICTLLQETFGRLGTLDAPIPRLPLLPDKYVVSGLSTDLAKLAAPSGTSLLASWLEAALPRLFEVVALHVGRLETLQSFAAARTPAFRGAGRDLLP